MGWKVTRRQVLTSVASLPVMAACAREDAPAAFSIRELDTALTALETKYAARIGVAAGRPGQQQYSWRGNERFAMCSTFKVYAVAAFLRLAAAGRARLADTVNIEPAALVENSPVSAQAAGRPLTYAALCEAALTRSDNTAANYILRALGGPSAVTALARTVGDQATRLDRWEPELNNADRGDERDTTSARALTGGFERLLLGDGLAKPEQDKLIGWMRGSLTSGARMRAGLPAGWSAAEKTGGGRFGTHNDAGVVWDLASRPLVLVILTDTATGNSGAPLEPRLIAEITSTIVRELAP